MVFYILHGEDVFSRSEKLARLQNKVAKDDPSMAELNTTYLGGARVTVGELCHACDTIPFMAESRLVIVDGLLGRLAPDRKRREKGAPKKHEVAWKREFLQALANYLPNLPETTNLIFLESKKLGASHPILKLARSEAADDRAEIELFVRPKDGALPSWIERRTRDKGGSLSPGVASMLTMLVGRDLRMLDQEIEKLLLYADGRPVSKEDVQLLVSRAREPDIFALVDSVGRRQIAQALRLFHQFLEEHESPLYILAMLARQIRILIQLTELRDQRLTQREMEKRLKLHPYVIQKGLAQARNFTMPQLEAAHQRIVEADLAIKTGKSDDVLALDLLVVELARG